MLLSARVHARETVQAPLDRAEDRREQRSLAGENTRHESAKRLHERYDDRAEERDLNPSDRGHGLPQNFSGRSSA